MKQSAIFAMRFIVISFFGLIAFQNCSQPGEITLKPQELSSNIATAIVPACGPNQSQACAMQNGHGIQFCSADGQPLTCQIESCDSGFQLLNGSCVARSCQPGSTTSCADGNGTGSKTCNVSGTGFGACFINACNPGFNLQNGTCVMNACVPNSNMACSVNNGSGSKICNAQGTGYGACNLSSCSTGYNMQNGTCVANVCSPNAVVECSENNGSGTKTCNAQGTGFGSCQINHCNPKYVLKNGVCLNTCFSNIEGTGKAENPYQIKNETDLLCMSRFSSSNVSASDNYWKLKTNLTIGASTYPVVGEVKLRGSEGDQFILVPQFNSGHFDGDYHTINYTVNCSLEANKCKNLDGQSYPKKDVAIFGVISNSTITKLKVSYDYSDIGINSTGGVGRAIVQYASGLTLDARKSRFYQVATNGIVQMTPQCVSGLTNIENGGSYNLNQENLIEQSYAKITAIPVGQKVNYTTSVAAFSNSPNFTVVKNSYADVSGALKPVSTGTTNGFASGITGDYSNYPDIIFSKFYVQNSYIYVNNSDVSHCLPSEFSGTKNSVDLPKNTVLTNSFWVGPLPCDNRSMYPEAILPLPPSSYSSAIQIHGWDTSIWMNGNQGLPQLKWLGQ